MAITKTWKELAEEGAALAREALDRATEWNKERETWQGTALVLLFANLVLVCLVAFLVVIG